MQTDGEQQRNPSKEGKRKAYYDRVVFIVDPFKAQKEEDDFKDSIAFYYPSPELEDDSKIFLCGQISGTYKIMSNFPGTHPKFVQTQNRGYAVKTLGRRFIIVRVCLPIFCTLYVYACPNSVHCTCMPVSCSCHCNALVFLRPGRPCTAVPWRTLPTLSGYWRNFTTSLCFTTIPRNTFLRSVSVVMSQSLCVVLSLCSSRAEHRENGLSNMTDV